jgi:protoporphyrinogen/coproporphyrinogen III oxidase
VDVVVIGAGPAGAAAAHELRSHGVNPVVLEAADGIGGRTRTVSYNGFQIDSGAIFVMGSYARTLSFLRASGHHRDMGRWRADTAVLDEVGTRTRVRFDRPWTLLRMPQLSWRDRLRAAAAIGRLALTAGAGPFTLEELVRANERDTLAAWARRELGDASFEYLVRPLMGPLTGADPDQISAAFTIALMHQVTRTQLTVPSGGMGQIARWLLEGSEVRLSTPADSLTHDDDGVAVETPTGTLHADAVIVATDVSRAIGLLEGQVSSEIDAALRAVTPIKAHHVLLGYTRDPWPDSPYDLVVRAGAGAHHDYGALLNGRRVPGSVPHGAQSVSIYFDDVQAAGASEEQLIAKAVDAVQQGFGPAPSPDFHIDFAMDVALIAPTPGHYQRMLAMRDAMPPRVRLAGDYLTHSGVEGAVRSGENAARDVLSALDRPESRRTDNRDGRTGRERDEHVGAG